MKIFGSFDGTGCGVYRIQLPLTSLKVMAGHDVKLISKQVPPPGGESYDLICMNRTRLDFDNRGGMTEERRWFAQHQANGTVIVCDIDDDIWRLNLVPDSRHYHFSETQLKEQLAGEERTLQMSDLITTTTPTLAKIVRRFNSNVAVIPNHVPGALLSAKRVANVESPNLIVGWAGGTSHVKDLQTIGPVLHRYKYEFPDIDLHSVGIDFGQLLGLPTRFTEWNPNIWEYYTNLDFDIGLAPLAISQFNKAKSGLKAIEYMALGIPIIATDIEPYREVVQHGVTGFLCRERRHWMSALRRLTTDEELRRKMSSAAREAAKQYTFEVGWCKWEYAYQEAVERRRRASIQRGGAWASATG